MTRRDRAAMVLAYQLLCGCGYDEQSITETLRCADNLDMWAAWVSACDSGVRLRLLRARLAIALRWLLRVDACGIPEPWSWHRYATCKRCGAEPRYIHPRCLACGADLGIRIVAPLWETAGRGGARP